MFAALALASALSNASCWEIFDRALQHNARSVHPQYVSYDERMSVTQDDQLVLYNLEHVDYRDDGTARLLDQRFDYKPIVSRHMEPGPPELGPYGSSRQSWLPLEDNGLPVISNERVRSGITCENLGLETYKSRDTYHLVFGNLPENRPMLKAIWVDAHSYDVWKLIASGYILFASVLGPPPLADFQVELAYEGPYLVVNHVVWTLHHHEFSQYTNYFGEYYLSSYEFPDSLPESYFAAGSSNK